MNPPQPNHSRGVTLIEMVIVLTIITVLAAIGYLGASEYRERGRVSRASAELTQIAVAIRMDAEANGAWPGNENRGVVPTTTAPFLEGLDFSQGPWPESIYDWDTYTGADGRPVRQVTLRFCKDPGLVGPCSFPNSSLLPDFENNRFSGIYYCLSGQCVAHPDHPTAKGYCVNC